MALKENVLQRLNIELEEGWEAKLIQDGRIYYVNHKNQSTSWLPPRDNWDPSTGLPYGWETGIDKHDKPYYINHIEKYTTRDDPRKDPDYIEPPKSREVELVRDPEKGFGFVAGSEKPVVVRFVTDGGPSVDKLLSGDQILKINGEDVRKAPREKVIELVRACKHSIVLTVCQPYSDNSARKSALLTAAKKAKLKNNPSRVRFADSVMVNGAPVLTPSAQESYVPFMPNVLKVFLENGQTKSFKYDNKTTVKDVMVSLQEKLNIKCIQHFNVVLQNTKNNTPGKMTLLQEQETLNEIAARPGARHFRCLLRVTYVPRDAYDLLKEDAIAFEYFYLQCCNDVVHERFASELKYDTALRLAALQIQQHAMSNNMTGKISIKAVEKECGLDKFVPHSLLENMKGKDLRKMLSQHMKMNQSLTAPGQKQLSALQAKLHYMKIVSELKTFGSRVFMVTLLDKRTEAMVLVGPKSGISVVTNIKSYTLSQLADFQKIENIKVTKEGENMQRVDLKVAGDKTEPQTVSLGLLTEDAQNFVCMAAGYYKIFVDTDKRIVERTQGKNTSDPDVPPYSSKHRVLAAPWTYPEDLVSEIIEPGTSDENGQVSEDEKLIDLAQSPPTYTENEEYLLKIKAELGIKMEETRNEPSQLTTFGHGQPGVTSLDSPRLNGRIYEEEVTSFTTKEEDTEESSLNSSASSQQNKNSLPTILNGSDQSETSNANKSSLITNGHSVIESSRLDEVPSDTDSGSGADLERRPLLSSHSGSSLQNGDLRNSFDIESDDTDSWGTPNDSPAKGKLGQDGTGLVSFGLHSPDLIDASETDIQQIAKSFGLHSPDEIPQELYNAMLNPSNLKGRGIYLDPDIIDLTLFPPPITPEDDNMIDFTELTGLVPPPFTGQKNTSSQYESTSVKGNNSPPTGDTSVKAYELSDGGKNTVNPVNARSPSPKASIASKPAASTIKPSKSSLHHQLAKSASVGHCPDFFDNDIDELIAKFTVPPPPLQSQLHSSAFSNSRASGAISQGEGQNMLQSRTHQTLEDEFAALIIPPPPESSSPNSEEIPVVPPVGNEMSGAEVKRKRFRHKRSASVDISSLQQAKEVVYSGRSNSLDYQPNGDKSVQWHLEPPSSLGHFSKESGKDHSPGIPAESPATVSEKLNNLLRSLPNVDTSRISSEPFVRTGSLKLSRSSSLDVLVSSSSPSSTASLFSRTSSLRGKHPKTSSRSSSCDNNQNTGSSSSRESLVPRAQSFDNVRQASIINKGNNSEGSESFASLKAKLQSYRDLLLSRSHSSMRTQRPQSVETPSDSSKQESLRRSNSFSDLLKKFSKQGSKPGDLTGKLLAEQGKISASESEIGSASGENKENGVAPSGDSSSKGDKKTLLMYETLALPRATLRPVSSSSSQQDELADKADDLNQSKSKKSGPLKALSSVFSSDEKQTDKGGSVLKGGHSSRMKSDHSKGGKKYRSKDDSSVTASSSKDKTWKANPYATIKMWRPISMTTSVSYNEDVFQNFSNFDSLREMSTTLKFEDSEVGSSSHSKTGESSVARERDVPLPDYGEPKQEQQFTKLNGNLPSQEDNAQSVQPRPRKDSVSDNSYSVVSGTVTDSVRQILRKIYGVDDFEQATRDVEHLLAELKLTMESLKNSRIDRSKGQFEICREELMTQTKQFVNDAKLLVSSATHTKEKLAVNLDMGIHTLAKIFLHSQAVMLMMESSHHGQHLGFEVIKVSNAFKSTVNAASAAVGRPLSDPHMKYLMRQATNLASLLSMLLKTLKTLDST